MEPDLDPSLGCRPDGPEKERDAACTERGRRNHESFFDDERPSERIEQFPDERERFAVVPVRRETGHRLPYRNCGIRHGPDDDDLIPQALPYLRNCRSGNDGDDGMPPAVDGLTDLCEQSVQLLRGHCEEYEVGAPHSRRIVRCDVKPLRSQCREALRIPPGERDLTGRRYACRNQSLRDG